MGNDWMILCLSPNSTLYHVYDQWVKSCNTTDSIGYYPDISGYIRMLMIFVVCRSYVLRSGWLLRFPAVSGWFSWDSKQSPVCTVSHYWMYSMPQLRIFLLLHILLHLILELFVLVDLTRYILIILYIYHIYECCDIYIYNIHIHFNMGSDACPIMRYHAGWPMILRPLVCFILLSLDLLNMMF